jgi:hypothetical protein
MTGIRRQDVDDLKALWSRVSRQHLSGGQGCGCGFGGLILMASDFELDIVEFLLHEAAQHGAVHVAAFVKDHAARGPDRYSLTALLEALATTRDAALIEAGDLDFAVSRLRQTLTNIESAHRKSRFSST